MSRPRRFSDKAREILYSVALEGGGTIAAALEQVRVQTGEEIPPRSARGIVLRERLKREQALRDAAFELNPQRATEDLAARIFAVAARIVAQQETRANPDLVRLKRAAGIVRELRPIVAPPPKAGPRERPRPILGEEENGHAGGTEADRLASALETTRGASPPS